jgi:hypothetical protein
MSFEAGQSGNPVGRPKGSYGGRIQALAALDRMLGKKKNQVVLTKALEQEFLSNPVRFFKTVVMPLLPRETKLKLDQEGVVQWRSLLGGDVNGHSSLVSSGNPGGQETGNGDPSSPKGYAGTSGIKDNGSGE